jgi:hypothetical protein
MFKEDWIACTKYDNRLGSIANMIEEDLFYDHFQSTRIFTLVMNKILT